MPPVLWISNATDTHLMLRFCLPYVTFENQIHSTGEHSRGLQHKKISLHQKSIFSGLYPVNRAHSNTEIPFTYHLIDYATDLFIAFKGLFMLFEGF